MLLKGQQRQQHQLQQQRWTQAALMSKTLMSVTWQLTAAAGPRTLAGHIVLRVVLGVVMWSLPLVHDKPDRGSCRALLVDVYSSLFAVQ